MSTGSSDYLNYSLNNLTIAILVRMASTVTITRTVTIAMTCLMLIDKQGKISFWSKVPQGRDSLPKVRYVQPCCADIQVFIGCAQIDVSSYATHLDAQNKLIN